MSWRGGGMSRVVGFQAVAGSWWWAPSSGGLPGAEGFQWDLSVVASRQCWAPSACGVSVQAGSKQWQIPSHGGLPLLMDSWRDHSQPQSPPSWPSQELPLARPFLSLSQRLTKSFQTGQSPSLAGLGRAPASVPRHAGAACTGNAWALLDPGWHCWIQAGSGAPGSRQRAQREPLVP